MRDRAAADTSGDAVTRICLAGGETREVQCHRLRPRRRRGRRGCGADEPRGRREVGRDQGARAETLAPGDRRGLGRVFPFSGRSGGGGKGGRHRHRPARRLGA